MSEEDKPITSNGVPRFIYEEVLKALKAYHESGSTCYIGEGDEVGECIHCGNVSYRPHSKDCPVAITDKLFKELHI